MNHTCSVTADGGVLCWGSAAHGVLGTSEILVRGQGVPLSAPNRVPLQTPAVSVAAGGAHSCAVGRDGFVYCWGSNGQGQLGGIGSGGPEPRRVSAHPRLRAVAVTAGAAHSCALTPDAAVACWGDTPLRRVPLPATDSIVGLASAAVHNCAVGNSGRIYCWGTSYGMVTGIEALPGRIAVLDLPGRERAVMVSAGGGVSDFGASRHDCAVSAAGRVFCWGEVVARAAVDTTVRFSHRPVEMRLPAGISARSVAAGSGHLCVVSRAGGLFCAGDNRWGQAGGDPAERVVGMTPVALPGVVSRVDLGSFHSCAIAESRLYCWGADVTGQRGVSPADLVPSTAAFPAARRAVRIRSGPDDVCAVTDRAETYCWGGAGDHEQLSPRRMRVAAARGIRDLARGAGRVCVLPGNGRLSCADPATGRPVPAEAPGIGIRDLEIGLANRIFEVTIADEHRCALDDQGAVRCWAGHDNASGVLGTRERPPPAARNQPVTVPLPSSFRPRSLALGPDYSCALGLDGEVLCWGRNLECCGRGGEAPPRPTPVGLPEAFRAEMIAAGRDHACAAGGGQVVCWGNEFLRRPRVARTVETRARRVELPPDTRVAALAAGYHHTCVAATDGSVYCWGVNERGQLGDGSRADSRIPVRALRSERVVDLAAGVAHTCALTGTGIVRCWGSNDRGQRGDGTYTSPERPAEIDLRIAAPMPPGAP
jgi:alpha-tubulin suppressor-like RCC1 family protein